MIVAVLKSVIFTAAVARHDSAHSDQLRRRRHTIAHFHPAAIIINKH